MCGVGVEVEAIVRVIVMTGIRLVLVLVLGRVG